MKITIVVAVGQQGEIGAGGDLLWRLPRDMQFFKDITMGHHVLMGRVTYLSIPPRYRPLAGRVNMVLSHTDAPLAGADVYTTIDSAIAHAVAAGEEELMVIGGAKVYTQILPQTDRVFLTRVAHSFPEADAHFPTLGDEWQLVSSDAYPADMANAYSIDIQCWERI